LPHNGNVCIDPLFFKKFDENSSFVDASGINRLLIDPLIERYERAVEPNGLGPRKYGISSLLDTIVAGQSFKYTNVDQLSKCSVKSNHKDKPRK
jgi:hypothetical protein